MEGDPFALVEAMTIAGFATGCEHAYLYVRGEYPLAFDRLVRAIEAIGSHVTALDAIVRAHANLPPAKPDAPDPLAEILADLASLRGS